MTSGDRLRAALRRYADRIQPGPDGLERIRAGIATRRPWWRFIDRMKKVRAVAPARTQPPTK